MHNPFVEIANVPGDNVTGTVPASIQRPVVPVPPDIRASRSAGPGLSQMSMNQRISFPGSADRDGRDAGSARRRRPPDTYAPWRFDKGGGAICQARSPCRNARPRVEGGAGCDVETHPYQAHQNDATGTEAPIWSRRHLVRKVEIGMFAKQNSRGRIVGKCRIHLTGKPTKATLHAIAVFRAFDSCYPFVRISVEGHTLERTCAIANWIAVELILLTANQPQVRPPVIKTVVIDVIYLKANRNRTQNQTVHCDVPTGSIHPDPTPRIERVLARFWAPCKSADQVGVNDVHDGKHAGVCCAAERDMDHVIDGRPGWMPRESAWKVPASRRGVVGGKETW